MNYYVPQKKAPTYLQREAAAKAKRQDQLEAWVDPKAVAIRAIRAEISALYSLGLDAARVFALENDPVALPKSISALGVHPSRAAALVEFTASWSDNPFDPIVPCRTERAIFEALAAETQARLEQAQRDLQAIEEERHREALGLPDPVESVEEESVIPADEVAVALDQAGMVDLPEIGVDEDAPIVPVRRGPGRPSKIERAIGSARVEE